MNGWFFTRNTFHMFSFSNPQSLDFSSNCCFIVDERRDIISLTNTYFFSEILYKNRFSCTIYSSAKSRVLHTNRIIGVTGMWGKNAAMSPFVHKHLLPILYLVFCHATLNYYRFATSRMQCMHTHTKWWQKKKNIISNHDFTAKKIEHYFQIHPLTTNFPHAFRELGKTLYSFRCANTFISKTLNVTSAKTHLQLLPDGAYGTWRCWRENQISFFWEGK